MDKEGIDFSIGLALSLELLERYKQNGTLHAELRHVPGVRGNCHVWLQLIDGKAMFCFIETSDERRQEIALEVLLRLDASKGPFAWTLLQQSLVQESPRPTPASPIPPPSASPPIPPQPPVTEFSPRVAQGYPAFPVFRQIAPFNPLQLSTWSARDKMILRSIFLLVDGRRSSEEIKAMLSISPEVVEEALRILQSMKVIALQ